MKKTNGSDKPGAEVSNNANQSDAKNAMLAQIKQGVKLKKVVDQPEAAKKPSNNGGGDLMKNAWATMKNSPLLGEGTKSSDSKSDDEDDDQNRTPDSEWEDESPTPQSDSNKRSKSPDSGHESDDNEKSKPTSPLHSVPKAGKPLVPPKTAGLQTKSEASPAAQANNVDSVNSEVQQSSDSVDSMCTLFGGKAKPFQVQSVVDRGKRSSAPFLK
ncbi:WH2 domain-containing protein [Wolbachia endosymbiont (group B) of Eupithecia inturbata]|uniref:WH2 domain-containing protein n=1 Tax=Wolbachia endosymbiont (group B) of Eupithecia inturbata TaxID=3139316 RepID=UPI003CCB69A3